MSLTLYNTLTRTKEPFAPLDPAHVRLYVCGPTVYDYAHIGNARPVIVFDVLFRLLRHLYGADHVTYVRNITDVDDKIMNRAREEGVAIDALTERTTRQFHEDIAALGVLPPSFEPRATQYIPQMIAMIERLIERGCAYEAEGHVLFHVPSMPGYGKLSGRSTDEMLAGARVEVAPYKKDPMDFVLWKPSAANEPGWESPWGRGRPGWHIECSAMSTAHLGETFDIHGGGIDLVFPHHENEIAQSTCAHGTPIMAKVWMHNGFLQVEGDKMSKSLGNFVTVHELLSGWQGYAWPGEALRFNMLRTHYRQPLDWTLHSLDESHKVLWDWYGHVEKVKPAADVPDTIAAALSDDLNTPQAIAELHKLHREGKLAAMRAALEFMGFSGERGKITRRADAVGTARLGMRATGLGQAIESDKINELIVARNEARKAKNFKEADRIRDELAKMGVALKDGPQGTTWEVAR